MKTLYTTYNNFAKRVAVVLSLLVTIGVTSVVGQTWELVTDVDNLAADDEVVIVANSANYALSTTQNDNNRGQASVTKNNNTPKTVTWTGTSVQVLTLKAGKTSDTFAFYAGAGSGYLYAASSSKNYLRTETTLSENSSWTITITSAGVATIKATGSNTRNWLRYNSSSSIFSCYSSGQGDVCIYKKVSAGYTITYNTNGGSTIASTTGTKLPNPLPTPTKTGYTFAGWYTNSTLTTAATAGATINADITLYAKWTPTQYIITYNGLEGATHNNPTNYTIESETITFTAPSERVGYNFIGWNPASITKGSTGNKTITAQWTAKDLTNYRTSCTEPSTFTVTYNANDATSGSVPEDNTEYAKDAQVTVSGNTGNLAKTGYTFSGWNTEANGTGTTYAAGDKFTITENTTLYAKWTAKTATSLTWSPTSYSATIDVDNTFPTLIKSPDDLSPITYSSSNTDVATIDANGNITLVAAGTTTITATFTETATHTGARASYTLTVHPSNCKWIETDIANINSGDEVVIAMQKTNGGTTLTYALNSSNGTSTYPQADQVTVENKTITSNVSNAIIWNISGIATDGYVLYPNGSTATWLYCTGSNNTVKVGTGTAKAFYIENNYLKNTQKVTVNGVQVDAYVGVSISTSSWRHYPNTTGVIEGQTLKFYKRECLDSEHYWVTWDAGDGTWEDKSSKKLESYQVGAPITIPAENPTREGYRFDGWTPAPTTMPAQNTTFTAKWTKVYKITWYENGVPSYTYVPSDNPIVTWEDNIADCGEKKFYGWTADDTFVSDPTTPPTLISKGTTIAGDVTYYAVYADAVEPANPGYTKVTTISEGIYLIATDNTAKKAYTGRSGTNTYGGYCTVEEIENDVISEKPDDAVEIIVTLGTGTNAGKFAIYDGTYYLSAPNGNSITFNNNVVYDWNLTNEGYIHSNGQNTRYLQYNSSSPRFACYTGTQKYAYLYKKQTTTYANFAVSCATYTITVTPPTGGTVTTNPADEAGAGQEITINVTPDDCKYLTALKYNDGSDHSINIASTPYTFTMPAADVTVTATFADKTATDIEILTSAHRMLMQGSAFVGEQVRITYNNGDKETLNWNDSRLTFSGHNTANLGSQTVTITYNGCGTQTTSYNIEVIDGLGITFWDGDYTETIKYEPGDLVDVDNRIGQNICSGWEFAGWSETKVANESKGFTPVHNFNATDAKVLYAVYVETSTDWISAYNIDELHSGAKYVIVAHYSSDNEYALTNTSTTNASYLDGVKLTTVCEQVREGDAYPYKDRYKLKVTPDENWKWQLEKVGNGWYMRNIKANKYLKVNSDKTISLTSTADDLFTLSNGYNDSEITAKSSSNNYLSWYNSSKYWNGHTSGQQYYLTNETNFTSTPPCSPLSATFHGNGGTVIAAGGSPTDDDLTITEPTRDAGITTPTAAFADCNGKSWTFVGWSDKEVDVTRVPVLTTDLLHDGGGNKPYKIQEDGEEFWAVYTNQGNPETIYGTITFTQEDWGTSYSTGTKTKTVGGIDYSFSYERLCKASTQGIQFEENNGKFANATSLGKINSIRFGKFNRGDIDDLKVYVGKTADNVTTALTAADLQVVENTYTYYPSADYAFFKVVSVSEVCYVEEITIDYGQPTKVWATTPDCSIIRILTDEEVYVTATKDRGIMATAPLTIKTQQLDANADVVITSTSSDVYFSATRDANFAKADANQPKTSLTLNADADGNLQQDIYVHYKPRAEGDGTPASVVVSANLATPNPSVTDDQTIHVRNLPAKFVIATKVGANWYALPANMSNATNPEGVLIEVDEAIMTATAPNTASYTLFPVKTTNGEYDRYATNTTHYEGNAYGDRVRFAAVNNNNGLWANNNENGNTIRNYAAISSISDGGTTSNTNPSYEWIITTTVVNGNWQYTLQTDQDKNQQYLRYWVGATGAPKWGTYAAGNNQLYFLPVIETEPFDYQLVEWYPTKMLIQTDAPIANPTAKIGDVPINNVTCNNKGSKLYEIAGLPLANNPTKVLTIKFSDGGNNYTNATAIPVIISQSATTVSSAPFTTLTKDVYNNADLVVRDGATLTIDGGTHAENTFFNVTIYPTSKISVPDGKKLTVHSLTFFGGIDEIYNGSTYTLNKYGVPELSLKGTLYKSIAKMDYVMRVDLDQMYSLTVPYDVQLADIKYWDGSDIALGSALYVSAYDGDARANQSKKTWIYETAFESKLGAATLKAGVGYTISAELQAGVGNEYSILRMPMMSNVASGDTEDAKTVAVTAWGIDANITDNHKGWNLVGNPYMTAISGGEADTKLVLGSLKETGTGPWKWVETTQRYVTIPSDDGTYYWQQKFTEAVLPPFKNFFVQVGTTGELVFDLGTRQSMPARSTQAAIEKEVEFEILMSNDARQDNTGLLISEEYSPAYEINADLEKMIGSMSVYTIYGGYKLAYNALSPINASEWIPVGYIAPTAGEYAFRLDDVDKVIDQVAHIYLIDYTTNTVTDLMVDDYQFTTAVGTNDTRFAINVILNSRDNTATGLDNTGVKNDQPIKFIYQDKMHVYNNGTIYDATGKQVTTINK